MLNGLRWIGNNRALSALPAVLALSVAIGAALTPVARAQPQRIVSINLCTDQFVLALADRAQIAGISRAGKDPFYSPLFERAAGLPDHRGGAEEIVMMGPDLVIAGAFANRQTVFLLERLGIPILNVPSVNRIQDLFPQIRRVADAIGRSRRGADFADALEERYRGFMAGEARATGALYRPGGYILGRDTIVHDVMRVAGLQNVGAELGIRGEDRLALELLIMSPPDFLIIDSRRPERPSLSRRLLQHPALSKMPGVRDVLEFPVRYWLCATPSTVEGAAQLAATVTEHLKPAPGNTGR